MPTYGGATLEERRVRLEQAITAERVVQFLDDDGDGVVDGADLTTLDELFKDADDVVTGILLYKGFTPEQLDVLALDRQVIRCWVGIASQLASERRVQWLDEDGRGPFDALGVRARAELGKLARGEIRSVKEPEAGANSVIGGEVDARPKFFAPDPNDPYDRGPGGF